MSFLVLQDFSGGTCPVRRGRGKPLSGYTNAGTTSMLPIPGSTSRVLRQGAKTGTLSIRRHIFQNLMVVEGLGGQRIQVDDHLFRCESAGSPANQFTASRARYDATMALVGPNDAVIGRAAGGTGAQLRTASIADV